MLQIIILITYIINSYYLIFYKNLKKIAQKVPLLLLHIKIYYTIIYKIFYLSLIN